MKNVKMSTQGISYATEMYNSCFTIFTFFPPPPLTEYSTQFQLESGTIITLHFEPLNNPKAHLN